MELPHGPTPSPERAVMPEPDRPALLQGDLAARLRDGLATEHAAEPQAPLPGRPSGPLPEPSPATYDALRGEVDKLFPKADVQAADALVAFTAYHGARAGGLSEAESGRYAQEAVAFSPEAWRHLGDAGALRQFAEARLSEALTLPAPGAPRGASLEAGPYGDVRQDADGRLAVSGGAKAEGELHARGYGVSFKLAAGAELSGRETTAEGVTTYAMTGDVSASMEGGARVPAGGLEAAYARGVEVSYQVSMPEAATRQTDLRTVHPFNPDAMPVGARIETSGAAYEKTDFKAFFRALAVQTNLREAEGVSATFEKLDADTVRVQAGPTEALSAYNGFGLRTEVGGLMLGRADALEGATLRTADFDVSTEAGRAAYADVLLSGELPDQNGNGVRDVASIQQLDYTSQTRLDASIGSKSLPSLDGPRNTGRAEVVTYPDGARLVTEAFRYAENVPLAITRSLDAEGQERLPDRRYAYAIDLQANAPFLEAALEGSYRALGSGGAVREGNRVALTFSEDEMDALRRLTQTAHAGHPMAHDLDALTSAYGERELTTEEFALALARNVGGTDYGFVDRLHRIAALAGGDLRDDRLARLPGTVDVLPKQHP